MSIAKCHLSTLTDASSDHKLRQTTMTRNVGTASHESSSSAIHQDLGQILGEEFFHSIQKFIRQIEISEKIREKDLSKGV